MILAAVVFDPLAPLPSVPAAAMVALQIVHSLPRLRRLRGPWTLAAQALLFPWAGEGAPVLLAALRPDGCRGDHALKQLPQLIAHQSLKERIHERSDD